MRFWKAMLVARKELYVFRLRKTLLIASIMIPIAIAVLLSFVTYFEIYRKHQPAPILIDFLSSFSFFFVILAAMLPINNAAGSIISEKIEKSLEPLLATPTSDNEILVGKNIAAFLPTIPTIWLGASVYMVLTDLITHSTLGFLFYPNWSFTVSIFLGAPLICIFSTGFCVFTSSKTNNVQTAYLSGVGAISPLVILYLLGLMQIISLNSVTNMLIIAAIIFVADILVYFLSSAKFNREEILTSWK